MSVSAVGFGLKHLYVGGGRISRVLFRPDKCATDVMLLLLGCLALGSLKEVLAYYVGLVPSKYYRVLGDKDVSAFPALVVYSVCLLLFISLSVATNKFVAGLLYISWRQSLTNALQKRYFRGSVFYKVNDLVPSQASGNTIDNADQRITQDVERLCSDLSQMVPLLIISPFLIGYYMYQSFTSTGYLGPVSVLTFFVAATVINRFLMGPVMSSVYEQEQEEGNFRYYHMLARKNCEAGAFYGVARMENAICHKKLTRLISVQKRLVFRQYWLNLFVKVCDYFASILSYVVIAFPIFYGEYSQLTAGGLSALVSKYAFVSIYLFNCFTNLIDLAASAANVGGLVSRIAEFSALLDRLGGEGAGGDVAASLPSVESEALLAAASSTASVAGAEAAVGQAGGALIIAGRSEGNVDQERCLVDTETIGAEQRLITVSHLTVHTPDGRRLLISDLTMCLCCGSSLLVTGRSGVGKSSLFRVIDGLWKATSGTVTVHMFRGNITVVPQSPYFVAGSLADQVTLPTSSKGADEKRMASLLSRLGLDDVLARFGLFEPLDDSKTWYNVLSGGEAQRLCLVRALYHQPRVLLLDEATSSIEETMEKVVYEVIREQGITVVTVGHRSSLRQYHQQELCLLNGGEWCMSAIL